MRAEVDDAQDKVLLSEGEDDNLEEIYGEANTNILVGDAGDSGDDGLGPNVHALHDTFFKAAGGNIADQTAAIKAEIQENIAGKATYDDITADIGTAETNAESAVNNSAITEGSGDTPATVFTTFGTDGNNLEAFFD